MGVGVSDPVVDAAMPRLFATDQNHNVNAIQQGEQGMNLDDVGSLLKEKAITNLVSIAPASAVADAVRTMNQHKIGAVVVLDQQKLVGIFTERDVLVRVVGGARDPHDDACLGGHDGRGSQRGLDDASRRCPQAHVGWALSAPAGAGQRPACWA